ncbi:hpms2-like DNA mismatch repair protein [Apiospora arundinis]
MSIRPLPPDVAAQIKSSITITSLNDAICGLVKNSLDAKATKVVILVDYSRGNCTVEDNGEGILPAEFLDGGGLGKPHCTSRFPPRADVHGRSGTFLASLAALSLLSITSRHQAHYSQNTVKIHRSDIIARHIPSLPDQKRLASGHGTRVSVRDLFGSMPVRVKQRAIAAEKGLHSRDLDRLRYVLASLALPWPGPVTISAHDSSRQHGTSIRTNGMLLHDVSDRGSRSHLVSHISRVLYTAGLSEEVSPESWVALKASASGIQFISVGVEPVLSEHNSTVLHDEINKVFSNSSFGDQEDVINLSDTEQDRRSKDRRFKTDGYTNRELKARRGVDRWPMFYIMIRPGTSVSPIQDVESFLGEGRQDLETAIDIVRAVITEFLRKHHFRPTRVKPLQANVAGLCQSGKARVSPQKSDKARSTSAPRTSQAPNDDTGDAELMDDISSTNNPDTISQPRNYPSEAVSANKDDYTVWTNPITKQNAVIDSRTGFILPSSEHPGKTVGTKTLRLSTTNSQPQHTDTDEKTDTWVTELLSRWRNPVFETSEAPIPATSIYFGLPSLSNDSRPRNFQSCQCKQDSSLVGLTSVEGRVSKGALKKAKVIAQVDQKFIFAKVPLEPDSSPGATNRENPPSLLVLIDQHAADERCRVEALMQDYFSTGVSGSSRCPIARTELLDQVLQFEITAQERTLFERYAPSLKHWGIIYDISPTTSALSRSQSQCQPFLKVTRLPLAIVERCRLEPRLLIDLLRKEVWHFAEHDTPQQASQRDEEPEQDLHWHARFHRCPQGILDMINSRACRSAIMFNDVLPLDDCVGLLSRLADCAMPFQCAHGRPSMVPLIDTGKSIPQTDERGSNGNFSQDFNRWKSGSQLGA